MPVFSLTFATPLCWSGPSGHCGCAWMASTRCGCRCIGPGGSTSATTEAWRGWTRQRQLPSMERLRWRSGGARLTSLLPQWAQTMTTTLLSARWDMISTAHSHNALSKLISYVHTGLTKGSMTMTDLCSQAVNRAFVNEWMKSAEMTRVQSVDLRLCASVFLSAARSAWISKCFKQTTVQVKFD